MKCHGVSIMNILCLGIIPFFVSACHRSEPSSVAIEQGVVERVNGCHISMDSVNFNPKYPNPFAYFRFVCDVSESALKEKNWWGNQPQPLMNTLKLGGCVRLQKTFYCAKHMDPGKSVTLEATFNVVLSDATLIEPFKRAE